MCVPCLVHCDSVVCVLTIWSSQPVSHLPRRMRSQNSAETISCFCITKQVNFFSLPSTPQWPWKKIHFIISLLENVSATLIPFTCLQLCVCFLFFLGGVVALTCKPAQVPLYCSKTGLWLGSGSVSWMCTELKWSFVQYIKWNLFSRPP